MSGHPRSDRRGGTTAGPDGGERRAGDGAGPGSASEDLRPWIDPGPMGVFHRLARASRLLEWLQEESLRPFDLPFADYSALRVLDLVGPPHRMAPSRLAELIVRTSGGVTKIVDRLERRGLVERSSDPEDRRRVLVGLTAHGLEVSREAGTAHTRDRQRVLDRLTHDEVLVVDEGVGRLLDALEDDRREVDDHGDEGDAVRGDPVAHAGPAS